MKKTFQQEGYKRLKKADRQEMEDFIRKIYRTGFADGATAEAEAREQIDIAEILLKTPGVGSILYDRIMQGVKARNRKKEEERKKD